MIFRDENSPEVSIYGEIASGSGREGTASGPGGSELARDRGFYLIVMQIPRFRWGRHATGRGRDSRHRRAGNNHCWWWHASFSNIINV